MADPVSFGASIAALSALAGTVAGKGYRYLKAVKDCSEDVRRLIAEVSALCGILQRLVILLRGSKPRPDGSNPAMAHARKGLDHDSADHDESVSSSESEDEVDQSNTPFEAPDFIYECQKTLSEIEAILNKFWRGKPHSSQSSQKASRFPLSTLRRLEPKDLKWPLSRSKMIPLFEALERHKSTCTIALAQEGLIGIHTVLEQTKISTNTWQISGLNKRRC